MEESYTVVATNPTMHGNPNMGTAHILFYYESNSDVPKPVSNDIFKKQKCWITSGYEEHIHNKISNNELFLIENITRTHFGAEEHTGGGEYIDWAGKGSQVIKKHNVFIPIIDTALPNIDTGDLNLPYGREITRGNYFIQNDGYIYGPFEITLDTDGDQTKYKATPFNAVSLGTKTYHITKTKLSDLEGLGLVSKTDHFNSLMFINSLKSFGILAKKQWEEIDYISMLQIFRKCVAPIKTKEQRQLIKKSQLATIQNNIVSFMHDKHNHLGDDKRLKRAKNLLEGMQGSDPWLDLIKTYMESSLGHNAIKEYYESNKSAEISQIDLSSKNSELENLKSEVERLKGSSESLNAKIQESKGSLLQIESDKKKRLTETQAEINIQLAGLIEKKEMAESEIEEVKAKGLNLEEKYKQFNNLQDLEKEIDTKNGELEHLERDKQRVRQAVEKQVSLLGDPVQLTNSLVEVHTIMAGLGYGQFNNSSNANSILIDYNPPERAVFETQPSVGDFIVTITERLNNHDARDLSSVEVANFLICAQQNLLLIIQGRPGCGKTSTVINIASSLGIKNDDTANGSGDFLNVPVARGWSGSRDLIGFYNSLRGEYQPAKTGIYQFLRNGEENNAINTRMILLDEANLSPMEHYWSDFIGLTDREGRNRSLDTGSVNPADRFLHPAKKGNLCFIATINNDSTTEPLSPRLLDRAPVISMDITDDREIDGLAVDINGAITHDLLESYFGRNCDDDRECSDESIGLIDSLIAKATVKAPQLSNTLHIEGRRRSNIEAYLVTAIKTFDNETTAQDFAISQMVLPHINGEGPNVKEALNDMKEFSENNNWIRSVDILDRIIKGGDSYLQHFSFV